MLLNFIKRGRHPVVIELNSFTFSFPKMHSTHTFTHLYRENAQMSHSMGDVTRVCSMLRATHNPFRMNSSAEFSTISTRFAVFRPQRCGFSSALFWLWLVDGVDVVRWNHSDAHEWWGEKQHVDTFKFWTRLVGDMCVLVFHSYMQHVRKVQHIVNFDVRNLNGNFYLIKGLHYRNTWFCWM